jgi:hypothetical protein
MLTRTKGTTPARRGRTALLLIAAVAGAECNAGWARRTEAIAVEAPRRGTIGELGELRELRGSGHAITSHPWDIGGVSGRLMLLRPGIFASGERPVVITALTPESRRSLEPALVLGEETDFKHTAPGRSREGEELRKRTVVHVLLVS